MRRHTSQDSRGPQNPQCSCPGDHEVRRPTPQGTAASTATHGTPDTPAATTATAREAPRPYGTPYRTTSKPPTKQTRGNNHELVDRHDGGPPCSRRDRRNQEASSDYDLAVRRRHTLRNREIECKATPVFETDGKPAYFNDGRPMVTFNNVKACRFCSIWASKAGNMDEWKTWPKEVQDGQHNPKVCPRSIAALLKTGYAGASFLKERWGKKPTRPDGGQRRGGQ